MDFAYWPLNVGPKPGGSDDENLGFLTVSVSRFFFGKLGEIFFVGKHLIVVDITLAILVFVCHSLCFVFTHFCSTGN